MSQTDLIQTLSTWAKTKSFIDQSCFNCPFHSSCNESTKGNLGRGNNTQLSYICPNYGAKSIRLAIVGIDHGDQEACDYQARTSGILAHYRNRRNYFNAHYRGVVKTAAAIYGQEGSNCAHNCMNACSAQADYDHECVLNGFAQLNIVKCVRNDTVNRGSLSSWTMKCNCSNHLIDEIAMLEPHLAVFHGVGSKHPFLTTLAKRKINATPLPNVTANYGEVIYEIPSLKIFVLFLAFPSRGHLARQWDGVVIPAVTYLRERGLIPP
jgi:hypothetical protein